MFTDRAIVAVAEHFPALTRGAAKLAEDALGSTRLTRALGIAKSPGQLLADLKGYFPDLKVEYPDNERFVTAPIRELKSDFLQQRNALTKALKPVEFELPHLGFHGTSQPFADKILADRSFLPIDFATATPEHIPMPAGTFVSGTGKGMETAVEFSNKWQKVEPGPVFILDIGKADSLQKWKNGVRHPYGDGEEPGMTSLMPAARKFKGTLYNLQEGNFSSVVLGHIDQQHLQGERALAAHLNATAQGKLDAGMNATGVLVDVGQRGYILNATRRLDLAHQAISKWLESKL